MNRAGAFELCGGSRGEKLAEFFLHHDARLARTGNDALPLGFQLGDRFAHETQSAVDLAEMERRFFQQIVHGGFHRTEQRVGIDARMQERRDVFAAHREIIEHLQHGDGFRHAVMNRIRAVNLLDALNTLDDVLERLLNVAAQRIVEDGGRGEGADGLVCEQRLVRAIAALIDEHILNDLDRRTQADAAAGLGESPEQLEQDVEMLRKERVKVAEGFLVEVGLVEPSILQLRVQAQLRPISVEAFFEVRDSGWRFAE